MSLFIPMLQIKGKSFRVAQVATVRLLSPRMTNGPPLVALGPHGHYSISGVYPLASKGQEESNIFHKRCVICQIFKFLFQMENMTWVLEEKNIP